MNCSSIIHPSSAQMEQVKAVVTALLAVKANCQRFCFYSSFPLPLFLQFFSSLSIFAVVKNLYGGICPHFRKDFNSKSWICNASV